VISVEMGEDDGVQLPKGDMFLQPGQNTAAAVQKDPGALPLYKIARAGPSGRRIRGVSA